MGCGARQGALSVHCGPAAFEGSCQVRAGVLVWEGGRPREKRDSTVWGLGGAQMAWCHCKEGQGKNVLEVGRRLGPGRDQERRRGGTNCASRDSAAGRVLGMEGSRARA